jgi:excisionase family DNA binding protein
MPDLSKYTMNINELAAKICVHRNTIRNWVNAGVLPCLRIGTYTRFNPDEIETFLQTCFQQGILNKTKGEHNDENADY